MTVSADLLSILACPSPDHAPLRLETSPAGSVELVCTHCLSRFEVRDGIPVLLADEARPGPNGLGQRAEDPASPDAPAAATSPDAPSGADRPAVG